MSVALTSPALRKIVNACISHIASFAEMDESDSFAVRLQYVAFTHAATAPWPSRRFGETFEGIFVEKEAAQDIALGYCSTKHFVPSLQNFRL